jgi:hypothetical protein
MRTEEYHSGDDVELVYLDWTYRFARDDFAQRVVDAAVELDLVRAPVSAATRADLVAIATTGCVDGCTSPAADRIGALLADEAGADPVYWLRKAVFRGAWLDHRVKHGLVEMQFDDRTGSFTPAPGPYPLPHGSAPRFGVAVVDEEGR